MNLKSVLYLLFCITIAFSHVAASSDFVSNPQLRIPARSASEALQSEESPVIPQGSLMPEKTLSIAEGSAEIPAFLDLSFPIDLQGKTFSVSDHEKIRIKERSIEAEAFGSVTSLDLSDNKLMCVTFAGYVLGPYYPDQDYMGTYFETIESLKTLLVKGKTQSVEEFSSFERAVSVLDQFVGRAEKIKNNAEYKYQTQKLTEAIEDLYDGTMPNHLNLEIQEVKDKKETLWRAVIKFDEGKQKGKISSRMVLFKELSDEYAVIEIRDLDFEGQAVVIEKFNYDRYQDLASHRLESFYENGNVKISSETKYQGGIKTNRYYNRYDEKGTRLRHLNETFYDEGSLKTASDYRYTIGKRYLMKYTATGQPWLSAASNFLSNPQR